LGIDVIKSEAKLVLVNLLRGNLSRYDLTKNAIHLDFSSVLCYNKFYYNI